MSLAIYLYICLSIYLPTYLYCFSLCLSTYLFIYLYIIYLSIFKSINLPVYLSSFWTRHVRARENRCISQALAPPGGWGEMGRAYRPQFPVSTLRKHNALKIGHFCDLGVTVVHAATIFFSISAHWVWVPLVVQARTCYSSCF
jgi:hypothetical protein